MTFHQDFLLDKRPARWYDACNPNKQGRKARDEASADWSRGSERRRMVVMKKFVLWLCVAALAVSCMGMAMADSYKIAVPNDPTNEGRALLLLQSIAH